MAFALSEERERELQQTLSRYPNPMAACIPVLHLCQDYNSGWVSAEVIDFVAKRLELSTAHVKGVVTFYSLLNESPPGKHQVWVCRTLGCALRGGGQLLEHAQKKLGVSVNQTTKNGRVTLRSAVGEDLTGSPLSAYTILPERAASAAGLRIGTTTPSTFPSRSMLTFLEAAGCQPGAVARSAPSQGGGFSISKFPSESNL